MCPRGSYACRFLPAVREAYLVSRTQQAVVRASCDRVHDYWIHQIEGQVRTTTFVGPDHRDKWQSVSPVGWQHHTRQRMGPRCLGEMQTHTWVFGDQATVWLVYNHFTSSRRLRWRKLISVSERVLCISIPSFRAHGAHSTGCGSGKM